MTSNIARVGELPLDPQTATSAASASSNSSSAMNSSMRDKEVSVDNEDFEEDIKIKQRSHRKSKSKQDDDESQSQNSSNSSSSSSSSSSPASLEEFIANPVAGIRSIERRTWARLVLLLMMATTLYMYLHPTAYYRTQLYFTDCVQVPGKGGYQHTICKPLPMGHPFA